MVASPTVVGALDPVEPGTWLVDVVPPVPGCVEVGPDDSVDGVDVVGAVVVAEPVAGTTDTGTGTWVAGEERTARYRLPRPMNATSISTVDHRIGNRRWMGRRRALHRDESVTARTPDLR